MCQFRKLYVGDDGYVVNCAGCRHYQVLFDGILLCMTEEEFQRFGHTVAACKQDLLTGREEGGMPVPTMRQGVHLLLTQQKIGRLHAMLEAAGVEATTQSLLALFEA